MKNNLFLPFINTTLPGPKTKEYIDRYSRSFGGTPPKYSVEKAYNCIFEDLDYNRFLVLSQATSIGGFNNQKIAKAATEQIKKNIPRSTAAPVLIEFNEKLLKQLPKELENGRVNYASSGTESVELAIQIARSYTGKPIMLSYHDSHHGYFGTPYQLSGDPSIRKNGSGKISDIVHVPYPECYRCPFKQSHPDCGLLCLDYTKNVIENTLPDHIAGILIEPILVNGGMYVPPEEYLKGLYEVCRRNSILFIVDEVYTGIGKTGKFLAINHSQITPDMLLLGKALAGGFPLAAVVTKRDITDKIRGGTIFTGTFSANLVSCAAGIATLDYYVKNNVGLKADKIGNYFMKRLWELSENNNHIGEVRGKGVLIGIDIVHDKKTREPDNIRTKTILDQSLNNGIIMRAVGHNKNVLAITPSPILEKYQVEESIKILNKVID